MAKFCAQCGQELEEGATFCAGCGQKVEEDAAPPAEQAPPAAPQQPLQGVAAPQAPAAPQGETNFLAGLSPQARKLALESQGLFETCQQHV